MSSTSGVNIVLGQGDAIKEVHNIRKQNLELNQQFVAQNVEEKRKERKEKVQNFETASRVKIKGDEDKRKRDNPEDRHRKSRKKKPEEESSLEGNLIDIKV